jgi:hypothetical protein
MEQLVDITGVEVVGAYRLRVLLECCPESPAPRPDRQRYR